MTDDATKLGAPRNRSALYSAIFSVVVLLLAGGAALVYSLPLIVPVALAAAAMTLGVRVLLIRRAGLAAKVVAGMVSVLG